MPENISEYKQRIVTDFNSRSNYDNQWRYNFAHRLVEIANLESGQKVLDIATGTGIAAIASAKIVGKEGKVIGVDISSGMLKQAQSKIDAELLNIELIEADADYLNFADNSFDAILCSSAIGYLTDIPAALRSWYRFLKPEGIVAFSCFAQTAMTISVLYRAKLQAYGVIVPNPSEILGTPEKCLEMLQKAGFKDIEIQTEQFGFYLSEAQRAWQGNSNSACGYQVFQLAQEEIAQLKAEYLTELEALATDKGI
ncbi:class I SAM-dependent methyltransferase [Chlorogloea sp. CCALA 695]|uniref:class I SAM-dependent methyltransferase n=1 Tax=Chlorogloea sp. CCALA 695 TaxID=2107693 RepID=UPI000D056B3B|nr:class I SAM-dependent methyltransferase [Chlorogloea sp. CCALA 695]PSB33981.1 methyltransferase type 11 [Chlorogloea sp. CCALA 695]